MNEILQHLVIRRLQKSEAVPYELLLDADPCMDVITKYIDDCEIYVAVLNTRIIGEYCLYSLSVESFEIKNIAVIETLQRQGIGKLLLDDATRVAVDKGASSLVIGTSNASFEALYLYQKSGFIMTGLKHNFILENYPEQIFDNGIQCRHLLMMTKQLK